MTGRADIAAGLPGHRDESMSRLQVLVRTGAPGRTGVRGRPPLFGALMTPPVDETDEIGGGRALRDTGDGGPLAATRLRHRCGPHVSFLDDRFAGTGRIDVLAVARTGVYVIDVRRWPRTRVEVLRGGGLRRSPADRLFVAGHDHTDLVEAVQGQRDAVRVALADTPWAAVPVRPVLCVVDTELPVLRTPAARGVPLLATCQLSRRLNRPGPLGDDDRLAVLAHLAEVLGAAEA